VIVRAHDVFCLYATPKGHVAALRGLTLDVAAGERVVVHGPNGSGKTTLMRVLTGEVAPSAGIVEVCGVDLAGAAEADRARLRSRRIGLVDQHYARTLRPEISVLDNVALQLRLAGTGRRAARERAGAALASLGLTHLARRRPATLSGGEAQRACVCAAIAHSPSLILADEPTGELDRVSAEEVYDLLGAAAAASGAALLLVSHDARAARIADRIIRIRDGRLSEEWSGSPGSAGPTGTVDESLVVDDRGWVRLPEPMRRRTGVRSRVRATEASESIVLTPAPHDAAPAEPAGPTVPLLPARVADSPDVATLAGITVSRADRTILDGASMTVRAGALTIVRGRSGAGKTTLLRILCGLERPDAGSIHVAGVDLADLDRTARADLRRRLVAVGGQDTILVESVDVDENLDLVRLARGLPPDAPLVESWVRALGLAPVRRRPVRVLSGGERQRVAAARVLAAQPALAVFDEPTSRQDEAHAEIVAAALVAAARSGAAVVAATHDPVLVAAADEVVELG
jgi:ABC-type lipoprotein export system ATPase subunit